MSPEDPHGDPVTPRSPRFGWSCQYNRVVTTSPAGEPPQDDPDHRRSPAEELEWIGAEVEARPGLMFWGTIAVAVIVGVALVVFIIVTLKGS